MEKQNPLVHEVNSYEKRLAGRELENFVTSLVERGHRYDSMRSRWLDKNSHFYRRRRGTVKRRVDFPWPGASNFVAPVIDMEVTRLVSVYMRSLFIKPMAAFITHRPDNVERARYNEKFFDWMLTHGMRDFRKQMMIHFNNVLGTGIGITKTYWEYKTRKVRRVFRRSDFLARNLPTALAPSVQEAASMLRAIQEDGEDAANSERALEFANRIRASQPGQLDAQTMEALKPLVIDDFDLDIDEEEDAIAFDTIMRALQNGPDVVDYRTLDVVYDMPRIAAMDAEDIIVPHTTTELRDASIVYQKLYFSETSFKQMAIDHAWEEDTVNAVLESRKNDLSQYSKKRSKSLPTLSGVGDGNMFGGGQRIISGGRMRGMAKDHAEGIMSTDLTELIEVWAAYTLMDVDDDGLDERVHCAFVPGLKRRELGMLKHPRECAEEHGEHPFDDTTFEITDKRFWSSRSVGEILDDVDREITHRRRMKANKLDLMVPMLKRKPTALFAPGSIGFIPGEVVDVTSDDDLTALTIPDTTQGDDREELVLLTWGQRITGAFDAIASQGAIHEARTKAEIDAIGQSAEQVLLMRTFVLQLGAAKFYNKAWDLYTQWGSGMVYNRVTGVDFIRPTRRELRQDTSLVPTGTLLAGNPTLEAQRAASRLKVLLEFVQAIGGPVLDGQKIDLLAALRLWLDRDGEVDARAVIRPLTQQEQQALNQQAQVDAATARLQGGNEAAAEFAKRRGSNPTEGAPSSSETASALTGV